MRQIAIALGLFALVGCSSDAEPESNAGPLNLDIQPGLALGEGHSCVLLASGNVYCWGSNASGQLGLPGVSQSGLSEVVGASSKVDVGAEVAQLVAGLQHTCALMRDGAVVCWGAGGSGQLGRGQPAGSDVAPRQLPRVPLGGSAVQLTAGWSHTCARLVGGEVRCWGGGQRGELGNGRAENVGDNEPASESPFVELGGASTFVSAGGNSSCALVSAGLRCWGASRVTGQSETLGDDEAVNSAEVLPLPFGADGVAVGQDHACAWDAAQISCWGVNDVGKLGLGDLADRVPGEAVIASSGIIGAVAMGRNSTCVLVEGEVRCAGASTLGELGQGNTASLGAGETYFEIPAVELGEPAAALGSGLFHACALLTSGGVRCWGRGDLGQLGAGRAENVGDDETPDALLALAFE